MKFVLIPDSFKGTLSSTRICELLAEKAREILPGCTTVPIPVADGGEGSVDCFLNALGGEKIPETVTGPFFENVQAFYGSIDDGRTAVIEMAACAGLPLAEGRLDPERTTTYGVGELILRAADRGARRIILGLGGSCTNDGGCGAAAAVGVRFRNAAGDRFVPVGGTLAEIVSVDVSHLAPQLRDVEIVAMCDIDNPMYGEKGAAYVFAPQKGADPAAVRRLDDGLRHLCAIVQRDLGVSLSEVPGAGAAGAMGAGMVAFFGAKLQMGIETVLDTTEFDRVIRDADVIFTGEGKLDSQSLRGKVVIGVARRAKRQGKPVVAIVGGVEPEGEAAYAEGVTAAFSINRLPEDFAVSRGKSEANLSATAESIFRLIRATSGAYGA